LNNVASCIWQASGPHLDEAQVDGVAEEELLVELLVEVEAAALEVIRLERDCGSAGRGRE
jgi:hypothetical protein